MADMRRGAQRRGAVVACLLAAGATAGLAGAGAVPHSTVRPGPVLARAALPGTQAYYLKHTAAENPRRNIPARPAYASTCANLKPDTPACIAKTLAAIDHARKIEHVKKMILPRNFASLPGPEQTFVVSDLERVDRGLRPFIGLARIPDAVSKTAATSDTDPVLIAAARRELGVETDGGNWTGNLGALAADYTWMYDDGPGSDNLACLKAAEVGCWGHRENILWPYDEKTLISGAATVKQTSFISDAQLFAAGDGKPPKLLYTWHQALAHGADGHH